MKMDEELYLLLKNSKIDPSAFQKLDVNTNFQIFVEAYASVKQSKLKKPLFNFVLFMDCLLYTSPSPRDRTRSRMPSSA